jgi:hypothetical protein
MRLGVIARAEAGRGLAVQSHEVCTHLDPERVLLIDSGRDGRFTQHPERYQQWDVTTARWDGGRLKERVVRDWLDGLDVVYSAETPYDLRLPQWAAEAGCGVVVQANPEMLGPTDARAAVTWWVATPWRLDRLPARTRVVPMPVPDVPWTAEPGERLRFGHTAGWPAVADRNGTEAFASAAGRTSVAAGFVIRGQHRDVERFRRPGLNVEAGCVDDRWDLYRDVDVLVMPRRFGGLCLPVLEALALGIPVVMPDCSPNEVWPGPRVPAMSTATVGTRAGLLPLHDTDPRALAATMDDLASSPELVDKLRAEVVEWVSGNTWEALKPLWLEELARACW